MAEMNNGESRYTNLDHITDIVKELENRIEALIKENDKLKNQIGKEVVELNEDDLTIIEKMIKLYWFNLELHDGYLGDNFSINNNSVFDTIEKLSKLCGKDFDY